jgi:hypothetical protein
MFIEYEFPRWILQEPLLRRFNFSSLFFFTSAGKHDYRRSAGQLYIPVTSAENLAYSPGLLYHPVPWAPATKSRM